MATSRADDPETSNPCVGEERTGRHVLLLNEANLFMNEANLFRNTRACVFPVCVHSVPDTAWQYGAVDHNLVRQRPEQASVDYPVRKR